MEPATQKTLGDSSIAITVEFTSVLRSISWFHSTHHDYSGGLELLFSNQRKHILSIPTHDEGGQNVNMDYLIRYLCIDVMKGGRKDMFIVDNQV